LKNSRSMEQLTNITTFEQFPAYYVAMGLDTREEQINHLRTVMQVYGLICDDVLIALEQTFLDGSWLGFATRCHSIIQEEQRQCKNFEDDGNGWCVYNHYRNGKIFGGVVTCGRKFLEKLKNAQITTLKENCRND